MTSFEKAGVDVSPVEVAKPSQYTDVADSTELAVIVYTGLGLVTDKEKARDKFGKSFGELAEAIDSDGVTTPVDLVMVPKLGRLTLNDLIERYDSYDAKSRTPKLNHRTTTDDSIFDRYKPKKLSQGQTKDLEAQAVLLGSEDEEDEPGLYLVSESFNRQSRYLKSMKKDHSRNCDSTQLNSVSIAGYMIRNAMMLERGEPLQDYGTYTRFPELGTNGTGKDNYRHIPEVTTFESRGRVYMGSRPTHESGADTGVRLSISLIRP